MNIGSKIKKSRIDAKLTQEQAAEALGISRQTISNWENEKSYPDVNSLVLLSEVFKTSIDNLIKGDIENIPVFIPDNKAILNKFNCLLMLQEQYQKESDELASIRDWLLPMLMNGQAAIED